MIEEGRERERKKERREGKKERKEGNRERNHVWASMLKSGKRDEHRGIKRNDLTPKIMKGNKVQNMMHEDRKKQ